MSATGCSSIFAFNFLAYSYSDERQTKKVFSICLVMLPLVLAWEFHLFETFRKYKIPKVFRFKLCIFLMIFQSSASAFHDEHFNTDFNLLSGVCRLMEEPFQTSFKQG